MIPYKLNPLSTYQDIPLTFIAKVDNSKIQLNATGAPTVSGLHYRYGKSGSWIPYIIGDILDLDYTGDIVQFWNENTALSVGSNDYVQFAMSGQIDSIGNIQSMLNYSNSVPNYGFYSLFYGCSALKRSPELPATSINTRCYRSMFARCTSLTEAPDLPATTLANNCYQYMFQNCTSLRKAPTLPATTLANYCYDGMFENCTSLVNAPELSATTLATNCYNYMFSGCTSLTDAPELPATTLTTNCYRRMFYNTSSLSSINVNFTQWTDATDGWVNGVAELGSFTKPSTLEEIRGVSNIPSGWTINNK